MFNRRQIVAIAVPDDYTSVGKPTGYDCSSVRWTEYLRAAGCEVREVDVRAPDILRQVDGCDGFMWRWAQFNGMARIARRLLPVLERELGLEVYPDQNTCWHYDDKIAQAYLFEALGIPTPRTWVFFDLQKALDWISKASFPVVMKLATGAASQNVTRLDDRSAAIAIVSKAFGTWRRSLDFEQRPNLRERARYILRQGIQGRQSILNDDGFDLQAGYVLLQEFLPNNAFDTRVTIIGHRAFGFRRFNRAGDFRASGSGKIDYDPAGVDERFIRLAFETATKLRMQSCAIDAMYRDVQPVVGEVSYTYVSGAVWECSGHWELKGDPESGNLRWVEGHMWPEEAQVMDFFLRLKTRSSLTERCRAPAV